MCYCNNWCLCLCEILGRILSFLLSVQFVLWCGGMAVGSLLLNFTQQIVLTVANIIMLLRFEWQTPVSQSTCTDEIHHSVFYLRVYNHFRLMNSHSTKGARLNGHDDEGDFFSCNSFKQLLPDLTSVDGAFSLLVTYWWVQWWLVHAVRFRGIDSKCLAGQRASWTK